MPLLLGEESTSAVADGRIVRIAGLPDFNAGDSSYKVFQFDGFFSAPPPDAVWVANGGGAGAVASGGWAAKEQVCLCVGRIKGEKALLAAARRQLLAAFPTTAEASVAFPGSGWDVDLQMFVRRYDVADINIARWLDFSIPLIATDPYKYALDSLSGTMGVFSGQNWYRTYTESGGAWTRTYAQSGSAWRRVYTQFVDSTALPDSLTLTSSGDADSSRVTVTVVGPLSAGDWWLESPAGVLYPSFGITDSQSLGVDAQTRTATLNGADVTYGLIGDWPILSPGSNVFRLVAGSQSGAYATVNALEAYQ